VAVFYDYDARPRRRNLAACRLVSGEGTTATWFWCRLTSLSVFDGILTGVTRGGI